MAKFSNASGSLYLNVYIEPGAQNIAANTTVVNWRITVSRTGAYLTRNEQGDSTLSLDINSGRVHTSNPRWRTSGEEFTMASGSTTVGHNADGTKTVPFSATFNPNNGLHGVITVSGNIGLTTIPRSSSVSVGIGTIGNALTININRQSSSFKHTVRYAWGNKQGTIASNVDTSTTWTIPMDFCNDIPNSTSGQGTIFVDTYSGSTLTGTQSTTFRATVPDTVKPTLTGFTLIDGNTAARQLIPGGQQFIQIISNIAVHFGQSVGTYGSTITGYYAEIVGKNQSTTINGGSLGIMNYNGNVTVRAWVTDSRGRTSNAIDRTVTVSEYFAPVFNFRIERSGDNSSTLTAIRNARIAPLTVSGSQRNSMTLTFRVAPSDRSSYTADNGPASGTFTSLSSLVNSAANLSGTYGADRSWDVLGILEDKFTRTEFRVKVSTEEVVFSYEKGNRFAVGKIVDTRLPKGSVESTGGYYLDGKPIQNHQLTSNDGYITNDYYTDFNTHTKTGIYHKGVNNGVQTPNSPSKVWGILQVYSANNGSQVLQIFTERDSPRRTFMRLRSNSVWYGWEEYVKTDHPTLQEKPLRTVTMGFPYRLNATLTRKGDMVTVTLNRRITNIDTFEYSQMVETIPLGYRPTAEVHMPVFPNVSASTKSTSILHLASDGVIRFTNGTAGSHVFTGTITYITNDPYPS
ncbi:TPA: hypothetical protein U1C81_000738 [Streptococcus suis]|nr:hypothetical protein [Streptococcus suis]